MTTALQHCSANKMELDNVSLCELVLSHRQVPEHSNAYSASHAAQDEAYRQPQSAPWSKKSHRVAAAPKTMSCRWKKS